MKLTPDFYQRPDTLQISRDLLGKVLITNLADGFTAGRIVEVEAYLGKEDRAAHSYGGRRTRRTETMYLPGGHAYVYLCYGIHHLFNIVTNIRDVPQAILIRALEPLEGTPLMMARRAMPNAAYRLTSGPGSLSKAMGIHRQHDRADLSGKKIWLKEDSFSLDDDQIVAGPRIGVAYAKDDALLPYRYYIHKNPWVSKPHT